MTSVETRRAALKIARSLGADLQGEPPVDKVPLEGDEDLTETARGAGATTDDSVEDSSEVDEIGRAAGLRVGDDVPFSGDEVDRRDKHRWELDPRSKSESE